MENLVELERLLSYYNENEAFLYLEDILFDYDGVQRNGIFIEDARKEGIITAFLYASRNELVTTGATFQLLCKGKTYLQQLLDLVNETSPRIAAIRERLEKTCAGEWAYAKDSNIVSKTTHSYTIWAVQNEVKFKSENCNFLLHLIPDLRYLVARCKTKGLL